MQLKLQVVGLFYNVKLTLPDTGQTVEDVMKAAIANPRGDTGSTNGGAAFNFGTHFDTPTSTATMSTMSVHYDAQFQSRVLGNYYPEGIYSLAESFDPDQPKGQYTVWQYYLFDQNDAFMPSKNISESFVNRSVDGVGRVTWRLVSILGGPTAQLSDMKNLAKRNPTMRAAPSV